MRAPRGQVLVGDMKTARQVHVDVEVYLGWRRLHRVSVKELAQAVSLLGRHHHRRTLCVLGDSGQPALAADQRLGFDPTKVDRAVRRLARADLEDRSSLVQRETV